MLATISFLGLYFELVFIRWLPGNIASLAFFSNIVMISAFFGLGVGYLITCERDLFPWFPPILLAVTGVAVLFRDTGVLIPGDSGEWVWSQNMGNALVDPKVKISIISALVIIFILNAIVFVPLGQKMRSCMERFPPLRAYTINVIGSIAGIAVFSIFSLFYRHSWIPVSWFILGSLVCLAFMRSVRQLAVAAAAAVLLCLLIGWSSRGELWSPYYVIQTREFPGGTFGIFVNKFFHQLAVNLENNAMAVNKYSIPYTLTVPKRVLVLGAGSGNDVAMALMRDVPDVDAVEIDPEIMALGRARHSQRPYDDPRVHSHVDDARSFLRKTSKKYDMVILGTLDSHALLSGMSNIRLDNFVYTRECLQDIQKRLTTNGIVALMFSVPQDWLGKKLIRMAASAFPTDIYVTKLSDSELFSLMIIAGPGAGDVVERPGYESSFVKIPHDPVLDGDLPSDDWPYLYLQGRHVPEHYVRVIVLLLAIAIPTVLLVTRLQPGSIDFCYLFLGSAFMLLETKSITTLSLLFGSTWLVNAFVFAAVLLMILLANWTVSSGLLRDVRLIATLLFASLALNYVVPLEVFLQLTPWARWLVPSLIIALPIYFAGILFARFLVISGDVRKVYGSNLIGCVLGGFLEYASMAVGLRFLFVMAAILYGLALLMGRRVPGLGAR